MHARDWPINSSRNGELQVVLSTFCLSQKRFHFWDIAFFSSCRMAMFGTNSIQIHVTPIIKLLFKEVCRWAKKQEQFIQCNLFFCLLHIFKVWDLKYVLEESPGYMLIVLSCRCCHLSTSSSCSVVASGLQMSITTMPAVSLSSQWSP